MIYLDTSAIIKLLRDENETGALVLHLMDHPEQDLITSALATVETARALAAIGATTTAAAAVPGPDRIVIGGDAIIPAVAVSAGVLDLARTLPPVVLRSIDAIHVATAQLVGENLDHIITYDHRMTMAAQAAGLRTAAPGP